MKTLFNLFAILLLFLPISSYAGGSASTNSSNTGAGVRGYSSNHDNEWFRAGTIGAATIKWIMGPLIVDGVTCTPAQVTTGPFPKFPLGTLCPPCIWPPATRFCGPLAPGGSTCFGHGNGTGTYKPGAWIYKFEADIHVTAGGQVGTAAGASMYDATAEGKDPWFIFPADLDSIQDPIYDLYIPLSFQTLANTGGSSTFVNTHIIKVSYETNSGDANLLTITIRKNLVSVINNTSLNPKYFKLTSIDTNSTNPVDSVSLSDIQSLVFNELDTSASMVNPVMIGIFLDDIPKPTVPITSLGDTGAVALIHNDIEAGATEEDRPLPVELSSFSSSINKNEVTLHWITSQELNNSRFDIERKLTNSSEWSKVGIVKGNGTTNEPKNYSFIDRNLNSGRYNYRLKQIDFNGNYEYYNLSGEVVIGISKDYALSQNFPNPFNPTTTISYEIPVEGFVTLKIYDVSGKEVAKLVDQRQEAGYYTAMFDGSLLSSGIYFYKLTAGDFVEMKRMVLLK